jgi:hypothetical protein
MEEYKDKEEKLLKVMRLVALVAFAYSKKERVMLTKEEQEAANILIELQILIRSDDEYVGKINQEAIGSMSDQSSPISSP